MTDLLIQINEPKWESWYNQLEWERRFGEISDLIFQSLGYKGRMEISILLTEDTEIKDLNNRYRFKDSPTNVLSFPMLTPEEVVQAKSHDGALMLGDVVFSLDTILREVEESDKNFMAHVSHLFIHGILHLMGYDHIQDDEAEIMESLEVELLKKLGLDNPYQ